MKKTLLILVLLVSKHSILSNNYYYSYSYNALKAMNTPDEKDPNFAKNEQQQKERSQKIIKELGEVLHYVSRCCRHMTDDCRKKLDTIEPLAAQLTYGQNLQALELKICGKDPIEAASSAEWNSCVWHPYDDATQEYSLATQEICGSCDEWITMLKSTRAEEEFVVNVLKAGHLTKKELLQNPELAKKLHDFEKEQYQQQTK